MKKLQNKVAVITGGASGIGKATAYRFADDGATVIIWDLNEERGQALADEMQAGGRNVHFMQVNTTDLPQVEAAGRKVREQFGRLDILINNAGITRDATLKKMTPEEWSSVINVNLTGVFNCSKVASEHMLENNFGRIVNAASVVALYGNFGQTNYAATKAGVVGMTKVWARELGKKGITVNAVAPGFIRTEMMESIPDKVLEGFENKTPVGRLGTPEEVASLYSFLASDEAAYINGSTISIDGGLTL